MCASLADSKEIAGWWDWICCYQSSLKKTNWKCHMLFLFCLIQSVCLFLLRCVGTALDACHIQCFVRECRCLKRNHIEQDINGWRPTNHHRTRRRSSEGHTFLQAKNLQGLLTVYDTGILALKSRLEESEQQKKTSWPETRENAATRPRRMSSESRPLASLSPPSLLVNSEWTPGVHVSRLFFPSSSASLFVCLF